MVGDTTDAVAFAVGDACAGGQIGVKIMADGVFETGFAVAGGEDDVDDDQSQRLGHGEDFIAGLRPLVVSLRIVTQGVALGWDMAAPLALNGAAVDDIE